MLFEYVMKLHLHCLVNNLVNAPRQYTLGHFLDTDLSQIKQDGTDLLVEIIPTKGLVQEES